MKWSTRLPLIVLIVVILSASSACCSKPARQPSTRDPNSNYATTTSPHVTDHSNRESEVGCFPEKNEFLKNLADSNIQILSKPEKHDKCGEEWKTFGTCCNTQSLEKYVKEMSDKINSAKDSFFKDASALSSDTQGQIDILKKHVSEQLLTEETTDAQVNEVISNINKSKSNLDKLLHHFQKSQNKCLAKQIEFRTAALCGICSGRSLAFLSEGKAIISLESCSKTIQTCDNYWRHLIEIVDIIGDIESELKKVKQLAGVNDDIFESPKHQELLSFIKEANLRAHLKSCEHANNCSADTAIKICHSLITLKKSDPLTKKSIENVMKIQQSMSSLLSNMSHQLEREKEKAKAKKGKKEPTIQKSTAHSCKPTTPLSSQVSRPSRKLYLSGGYSYGEVTVWSSSYPSYSSTSTRSGSTWMSGGWKFP